MRRSAESDFSILRQRTGVGFELFVCEVQDYAWRADATT